jgi:hypothetical protein
MFILMCTWGAHDLMVKTQVKKGANDTKIELKGEKGVETETSFQPKPEPTRARPESNRYKRSKKA